MSHVFETEGNELGYLEKLAFCGFVGAVSSTQQTVLNESMSKPVTFIMKSTYTSYRTNSAGNLYLHGVIGLSSLEVHIKIGDHCPSPKDQRRHWNQVQLELVDPHNRWLDAQ